MAIQILFMGTIRKLNDLNHSECHRDSQRWPTLAVNGKPHHPTAATPAVLRTLGWMMLGWSSAVVQS